MSFIISFHVITKIKRIKSTNQQTKKKKRRKRNRSNLHPPHQYWMSSHLTILESISAKKKSQISGETYWIKQLSELWKDTTSLDFSRTTIWTNFPWEGIHTSSSPKSMILWGKIFNFLRIIVRGLLTAE